jgi:hypothetical protein
MPGSKCQYFNCFKIMIQFPNLSMFRFFKDEVRCENWVLSVLKLKLPYVQYF